MKIGSYAFYDQTKNHAKTATMIFDVSSNSSVFVNIYIYIYYRYVYFLFIFIFIYICLYIHTDLTVMSLFASSLDDHQKAKGNPKLEVFGSSGKGSLLHLFGIYARTVTLGVLRGVLFWLVWYFAYVVFQTMPRYVGSARSKASPQGSPQRSVSEFRHIGQVLGRKHGWVFIMLCSVGLVRRIARTD